jgi:hypothetical protein
MRRRSRPSCAPSRGWRSRWPRTLNYAWSSLSAFFCYGVVTEERGDRLDTRLSMMCRAGHSAHGRAFALLRSQASGQALAGPQPNRVRSARSSASSVAKVSCTAKLARLMMIEAKPRRPSASLQIGKPSRLARGRGPTKRLVQSSAIESPQRRVPLRPAGDFPGRLQTRRGVRSVDGREKRRRGSPNGGRRRQRKSVRKLVRGLPPLPREARRRCSPADSP